jgi:hypothetical protein
LRANFRPRKISLRMSSAINASAIVHNHQSAESCLASAIIGSGRTCSRSACEIACVRAIPVRFRMSSLGGVTSADCPSSDARNQSCSRFIADSSRTKLIAKLKTSLKFSAEKISQTIRFYRLLGVIVCMRWSRDTRPYKKNLKLGAAILALAS